MEMLNLILALYIPYYALIYYFISSAFFKLGASHNASQILAGVLCLPIGWAVVHWAGWFFNRLVEQTLAPNEKRVARSQKKRMARNRLNPSA